jgi:hypothetical protein
MSVPTLQDLATNAELEQTLQEFVEDLATNAELEQHIQDHIEHELGDHKLFPLNNPLPKCDRYRSPSPSSVSDPQSESDDATMSETSSLREQDAEWASILHDVNYPPSSPPGVVATTLRGFFRQVRPHRNPPSSSDESSDDDTSISSASSYSPSLADSEMYLSDDNFDASKITVAELRALVQLQAQQYDNRIDELTQGLAAVTVKCDELGDDQTHIRQALAEQDENIRLTHSDNKHLIHEYTRNQRYEIRGMQQENTRYLGAIATSFAAPGKKGDKQLRQLQNAVKVDPDHNRIHGTGMADNIDALIESALDSRSARVPEASSSRKNKGKEPHSRSDSASLAANVAQRPTRDSMEETAADEWDADNCYVSRTKQTARATTSQPAPRVSQESEEEPPALAVPHYRGSHYRGKVGQPRSDQAHEVLHGFQARTKQTARATTSQAAPRRSSQISPLTGAVIHYATSSQAASNRSYHIARMDNLVDLSLECINQALNRHAAAAVHFEQAKAASAFASDDLTDVEYQEAVENAGASWCHLQDCVLKVKAELEEWLEYKVALAVLEEEVCPAAAREELTEKMEDALRIVDLPPRPNGHWRQEDGLWRFVTHQEMRSSDEDLRRWEEEDLCSECSTDCDSE